MFSITTPVHNSASSLAETFHSLKSQYYENWEWIIIDDYSKDNCEIMLAQRSVRFG